MSIDNKKIKKILEITAAAASALFIGMSILAGEKKASSVYEDDEDQKNPFEGKKVILVEDENDKENADGIKGHLEAVEDSDYHPGFYERRIKRVIDVILSLLLKLKIQVLCYLHKRELDRIKNILNYINFVL